MKTKMNSLFLLIVGFGVFLFLINNLDEMEGLKGKRDGINDMINTKPNQQRGSWMSFLVLFIIIYFLYRIK